MKTVPLTRGYEAIVDDEFYERLSKLKWTTRCSLNKKSAEAVHWYRDLSGKVCAIPMQRMVIGCPKGKQIDHVNGNRLDNRKENLRPATSRQNNRNKRGWGVSGFKGVYLKKQKTGTYYNTRIRIDYGILLLDGLFNTPEEAARMYDAAAIKYHGEFARLNFPKPTQSEAA